MGWILWQRLAFVQLPFLLLCPVFFFHVSSVGLQREDPNLPWPVLTWTLLRHTPTGKIHAASSCSGDTAYQNIFAPFSHRVNEDSGAYLFYPPQRVV